MAKICNNGWQLKPGRHNPVRLDSVKHDPPEQILADMLKLEDQISARAKAFQSMLKSSRK